MPIQRYERPTTLDGALALLSEAAESPPVLVAGATDLAVDVRRGRDVPFVVDVKQIPELNEYNWTPDGALVMGACVTMKHIGADPRVRERYPALAAAADDVGSYQIRCRATIAGNLGNASPCADTAPPLLVLQARLRLRSRSGEREVPLETFFVHVKRTTIQPGEIITHVIIPPQPPGLRNVFLKIKRVRGHDLALVNAAGAFDPIGREIRLAVGAAAPTPILVPGLEGICPEGACPEEVGEALAERALAAISPIDDVRASAEYRRDMVATMCRRIAAILLEPDAH